MLIYNLQSFLRSPVQSQYQCHHGDLTSKFTAIVTIAATLPEPQTHNQQNFLVACQNYQLDFQFLLKVLMVYKLVSFQSSLCLQYVTNME
jgi:hypothetical protein